MKYSKKTLDPVIALSIIAMADVFLFPLVGGWTVGGGETMMTGYRIDTPFYAHEIFALAIKKGGNQSALS